MTERIVSLHAFYPSGDHGVDAYLSHPTAPGRWPAVIIVYEWWGLEDHFRNLSRQLAREDVALVPDLYHEGHRQPNGSSQAQDIARY